MTDAEFDKLEDKIRALDPDWKELKKTGVKVSDKKTETLLWRPMPSLNKMYPEAVSKFYARPANKKVKTWIWMDKLDGTSLQLVYEKGVPTQLITRGDGTRGGDISFFIPHLVELGRIPKRIPDKSVPVVFRIEGLMKKAAFDRHWSRKAKGEKGFDNIRNCVNGLFNRRDMHPALKHVDLVVLGMYGQTLEQGLGNADEWGFEIVPATRMKSGSSEEEHKKALLARRVDSFYEMDGLVIAPTEWVMRYADAEKPKELVAFKLNDEQGAAEVKVEEIIWQKTRLKRWQPKIRIAPTEMDGVVVQNATAHNPIWMQEKGIGPGAIVKVLRSGGVIPKIVGVVKKAKFQGPPGPYTVEGRLFKMDEHDATTEIRALHHFLTTLGVELLAQKSVAKMYEAGVTTPLDYVKIGDVGRTRDAAAASYFWKAGFGQVDSYKKANELIRVFSNVISMKKLMVASGCFESVGEKRLSQLEQAGISMLDLYKGKATDLYQQILLIRSFKDKTAQMVIDGKLAFTKWYKPLREYLDVDGSLPKQKVVNAQSVLYGMNVSFTGYRDKEQEATIEAQGGSVISFSSKTDVLLYSASGKTSSKVEKAGSRAMTWEQFSKKYRLEVQ